MSRVHTASCLVALLLVAEVNAAPHRHLDVRKQTDADATIREISLCARPSPDAPKNIPGHMFVAFSVLPPSGRRAYLAIGHTTSAPPKDAILSYFSLFPAVTGTVSEELYTSASEECLVLRVDKADFDSAYAKASARYPMLPRTTSGWAPILLSYRLGDADCMGFAIDVARVYSNSIRVPQRTPTETPLAYVRRLIEAN